MKNTSESGPITGDALNISFEMDNASICSTPTDELNVSLESVCPRTDDSFNLTVHDNISANASTIDDPCDSAAIEDNGTSQGIDLTNESDVPQTDCTQSYLSEPDSNSTPIDANSTETIESEQGNMSIAEEGVVENVTINANLSPSKVIEASSPPLINVVECQNSSAWISCITLDYGDTITQVRTNCTSTDGPIVNATFTLTNIEDNATYFSNTTNSTLSGYWILDILDLTIQDSGIWNLSVACEDNLSQQANTTESWLVPWGSLQSYLIDPLTSMDVTQFNYFNFSTGVRCNGGECGNVSAILDPKNILKYQPSDEILAISGSFVPPDLKLQVGSTTVAVEKNISEDKEHFLVQFDSLLSREERAVLEKEGMHFLRYIPNKAWLVSVNKTIDAPNIRWYGKLDSKDKISSHLHADRVGNWSINPDGDLTLLVQFYSDVPLETARDIIRFHNGIPGDFIESISTLVVKIAKSEIGPLADEDSVMWIGEFSPPLTSLNDEARQVTGAEELQEAPFGLDGTGIKVYVFDGGLIEATHGDMTGRVTLAESGFASSHPTHVACTVGGTGARSENFGGTQNQWRGMAPNVTFISGEYDSCSPYCLYNSSNDIEEDYNYTIQTYDIDIATNSIGANIAPNNYPCEWEGDYELTAQLVDGIIRGSLGKPLPGIWANGNERGSGRCGTSYGTTAPPATMKNAISVGATNKDDTISYYTSFGPTDDGRIKPDVTAPGTSLYSCSTGNGYTTFSGTSMAAPTTTGNAALLMQAYRQTHDGVMSPSTLKALLIHGAEDLGNPGPDYQFGYGRINSSISITYVQQDDDDNQLIIEENISEQDDTKEFSISVPGGTNQLKVTLVWTDYPGTPLAQKELVNDLDLVVLSPASQRFYPWTLNASDPSLNAVRDKEDHINNIEQVLVDSPTAGIWKITIMGSVLPMAPQDFSLVSDLPILSGKGVIPMNSGTPFYTTDQNPVYPANQSCLINLQAGDSCNQTWEVNGTGPSGTWEFFSIYRAMTYSAYVIENETLRTNVSIVDLTPPVISSILNKSITNDSAVITWNTDDPSNSTVDYGLSPSSLTSVAVDTSIVTNHSVNLSNLDSYTSYYYNVSSCNLNGFCSTSNLLSFKTDPQQLSITQFGCNDGTAWMDCSNISYGDNLTGVRVNCTSKDGSIINVTIQLENVPDSNIVFIANATEMDGYWVSNSTVLIEDSGLWNISVSCRDNVSQEANDSSSWMIAWGSFEQYLINQVNRTVRRYQLFNFSSGVRCINGECGNVTATLDPYGPDSFNYTGLNSTEEGGDSFVWEEIITNGEGIELWGIGDTKDDGYLNAPLNFTFPFYGQDYTTLYVTSNGRIHLTVLGANSWNIGLPSNSYKVVAPVNEDMYVRSETEVYYKIYENPKRVVIEYKDLDHYYFVGNYLTYEVILYEDGRIKFQYNATNDPYNEWDPIGINHNSTHNYYLLVEDDLPDLYKGKAITFYPPGYDVKKGVVPMNSGTPFYTINQNPVYPANQSCLGNMKTGDTCNQTWEVNATGDHLSSWDFFTIYESENSRNETARINLTIEGNYIPAINLIECEENNSVWVNCSDIIYLDSLTRVRVNCTDVDGTVTNVNVTLKNIPDNQTFFENATAQAGDYWLYDNADITGF